jgi:hypothetical protein
MSAGGNPLNVKLGPGRLYYAPIGTTEPVSASATLPSAWQVIGYTEAGSTIDIAMSAEDIVVAEEIDPIGNVMTARTQKLSFEMVETTKRRLLLATGGGAAAADDATPFELPDVSALVPVMFVWDSDLSTVPTSANARWLLRSASPSGTISRKAVKAPGKRSFAVEFSCFKPDAVNQAVKIYPALATGSIGQV